MPLSCTCRFCTAVQTGIVQTRAPARAHHSCAVPSRATVMHGHCDMHTTCWRGHLCFLERRAASLVHCVRMHAPSTEPQPAALHQGHETPGKGLYIHLPHASQWL